jgi:hypothetical protein
MTTDDTVRAWSPADAGALLRHLPTVTLVAVLIITATAEFDLARQVLALPSHIAWALPLAIDSYVYAAMRSGRDIASALTVMAGSLAAYTAAHLAAVHTGGPLPAAVLAPSATVIMTVLVVVAWRVHVLIHRMHHDPGARASAPADTAASTPHPSTASTGTPHPGTPDAAGTPVASTGAPAGATHLGTPGRPSRVDASAPSATEAGGRTDNVLADEDSVIVAAVVGDLVSQGRQAEVPSVRALRRAHALGQRRATRIRQALIDHQQASEAIQESPSEAISEAFLGSPDGHRQAASKKGLQERPRKRNEYPDTCITDRVGPAKQPGESGAAHSANDSAGISDGTVS